MLSTVTIYAIGHTGEETLDLIAGNETASFENVGGNFFPREYQVLEFSTDQQLNPEDIEIQFNNDLYQPETGFDRNLTINRIEIDGTVYETESATVYSEGNFFSGEGNSGFGFPDTLYGNGKFVYGQDPAQSSELIVYASGSTGEERMSVLVDDRVVGSFGVNQDQFGQFGYRLRVNQILTGEEVRVRFDNDLYIPDEGIDRNLFVDRIEIDGQVLQTESPQVVSTGTYRPGVGVQTGNFETETLHTWGEFIFFDGTTFGTQFAGRNWVSNDAAVVTQESGDRVSVSTDGTGDGIFSTEIAITEGQRFKLFADIVRRPSSNAANGIGEASLGVTYLDQAGNEVGNQFFDINQGFPFIDQFVDAPAGTSSGFATLIVRNEDAAKVNFSRFTLTQVNAGDTSPPEVVLLNDGEVFTEPTTQLRFTARYTDDTELVFDPGDISVRRVNTSRARQTDIRFQNSPSVTEKTAEITYSPAGALFSRFTPEDNGVYELVLRGDTLRDASGNFAAEKVLGTFTIDIPETVDTTPPSVVVTQRSSGIPQAGIPAFNVQFTDDESGIDLDRVTQFVEDSGMNAVSVINQTTGEQFFLMPGAGLELGNGVILSYSFDNPPTEPGRYEVFDEAGFSDLAGNRIENFQIGSLQYGVEL